MISFLESFNRGEILESVGSKKLGRYRKFWVFFVLEYELVIYGLWVKFSFFCVFVIKVYCNIVNIFV